MDVRAARAAVLAFLRGPAVVPFLVTRAFLVWLGWWTLHVVPLEAPPWQAFPHNLLLDGWLRWDSGWYLSIASGGYSIPPGGGEANVAFFPLYPIAAWLGSFPLRLLFERPAAIALAGLGISQGAFFVGLRGVHRLASRRLDARAADRAVWLLCLFPFSMFMSAFYSEALFLALAAWAFVAADEDHWGRAAILAGLAVLTRVPGLVVAGALVVQALLAKRTLRERLRAAGPVALAPVGLAALMIHHAIRFGDPIVMFRIRGEGWHKPPGLRTFVSEAWGLLYAGSEVQCIGLAGCLGNRNTAHFVVGAMNLVLLPVALGLAIAAPRRLGPGLRFFAVGASLAGILNGVEAGGRAVATIFPIFLVLAALAEDRAFFRFLCAVSAPLLILLTFYFSHWLHVT